MCLGSRYNGLIMAALALLILIGGCGKGVQTADPAFELEAKDDQLANQRQAVGLYVDAMMLKELDKQD